MAAGGPATEAVPTDDDESVAQSRERHPFAGWIVAAVFLAGTLYMTFAQPWPTFRAERFYAIIFGVVTVVAAGYALREHGILEL